MLDDSDQWEFNRILDSKLDGCRKGRGLVYLVEWKGFNGTPDATSWELPANVENAPQLVEAFHLAYPDKPSP